MATATILRDETMTSEHDGFALPIWFSKIEKVVGKEKGFRLSK